VKGDFFKHIPQNFILILSMLNHPISFNKRIAIKHEVENFWVLETYAWFGLDYFPVEIDLRLFMRIVYI